MRTEFPRKASFLLVALLAIPTESFARDDALDALRERALSLVNAERQENGLGTLSSGAQLDEAALAHARDMLKRDYYAHVSPGGGTVQDRYVAAGGRRWELVAENIARCEACKAPATLDDVERLHRGWMNSPGHRANILAEGLARFGFAIVADDEQGLYAVQTFAGPGRSRGADDGESASTPEQRIDRALTPINEARRQAGVAPLTVSPALRDAALASLPEASAEPFDLPPMTDLYEILPEGERGRWRALSIVAGACGGCGADPTGSDASFFADGWLENPKYRETLLDGRFSRFGFGIAADGNGKKVAVAVLGAQR